MKQDINLNLYRVFYYVATLKSFSEASTKLCISQPATSKQIKNLEDVLGTKLFFRKSRGIELTADGKYLLEQVEKMGFYLDAVTKYLALSKSLEVGELVIGCPSHITSFYLLQYIEGFRKEFPGIHIKVVSDSTMELIEQIEHHKIDFIIDSSPIAKTYDNLIIEKLKVFETCFIVDSSIDNIHSIEDLNNKNFVMPLSRSSMRKNLEKLLKNYDVEMNVVLEVDTTNLMIESVKRKIGIGYVVEEAVKEDLEHSDIKKLNIKCELPKLELNLVYTEGYLSPSATYFLKKYIINQ